MTKLVALEPMELKTTMPENVTTGGKRKTKGRKSMKKGMKKSMKKGMKKSMKKGMKMKRKTHKKKYLKKKKGGDTKEEIIDDYNKYGAVPRVMEEGQQRQTEMPLGTGENPKPRNKYRSKDRKAKRQRELEMKEYNNQKKIEEGLVDPQPEDSESEESY